MPNICNILEDSQLCRSHSFLIRYKEEAHELNDGFHWRLTVDNVGVKNKDNLFEVTGIAERYELRKTLVLI